MGTRTYLYFLLFLSLPLFAKDTMGEVIPAVIVKAKKPANTYGGPKTFITREEMAVAGVNSLAQALNELGGLQLQDMAGNGSQTLLNMRGFGSNASSNTLLLINGIPITNPDLAPPDLNAIPVQDIETIEIIAGSESVLYGDQAVGGSVNIVTRNAKTAPPSLTCHVGSYQQRACYFSYHNYFKQLNYHVTVSHNQTDNYRAHNDYAQNLLFGGVDLTYTSGKVFVDYKFAKERMQYPGALTAFQVRQNREQASNDTDFFNDSSYFLHLTHQHSLAANWLFETDLAVRNLTGNGFLTMPFDQARTVYFLRPQVKGEINSIRLVSGADIEDDHYQLSGATFLTRNRQQKLGLFSLAQIQYNPRLRFSVGARAAEQISHLLSFTNNDTINKAMATTLGFNYQLNSDSDFYLRRVDNFRFPKADENANTPSGITALRTQRGVAYESGITWASPSASAKIGIYQLNLRDEIAFDPTQTEEQPFGSNRNLAPTQRRGFTLSGEKIIFDKLTLGGQYNFVNAVFQHGNHAGNRIPLVSENIFRANLRYEITKAFSAYSEIVFTGNQYAANDDANISGRMGGYAIYNVNVSYKIKQFEASLRVNNLFNKDYYFYTVYQPGAASEFFYPAPERNAVLLINYFFA